MAGVVDVVFLVVFELVRPWLRLVRFGEGKSEYELPWSESLYLNIE